MRGAGLRVGSVRGEGPREGSALGSHQVAAGPKQQSQGGAGPCRDAAPAARGVCHPAALLRLLPTPPAPACRTHATCYSRNCAPTCSAPFAGVHRHHRAQRSGAGDVGNDDRSRGHGCRRASVAQRRSCCVSLQLQGCCALPVPAGTCVALAAHRLCTCALLLSPAQVVYEPAQVSYNKLLEVFWCVGA